MVCRLLEKLRREDDLAIFIVSHDLNVVLMTCDWTIVLQQGLIMEEGDCDQVFIIPAPPIRDNSLRPFPIWIVKPANQEAAR